MSFEEEYTTTEREQYVNAKAAYDLKPTIDDKGEVVPFPSATKQIISNDAYAVTEFIDLLIKKLDQIRRHIK